MNDRITTHITGKSNKGILLADLLLQMRPTKWGVCINSNKIPAYIHDDNAPKCMHALHLLDRVATETTQRNPEISDCFCFWCKKGFKWGSTALHGRAVEHGVWSGMGKREQIRRTLSRQKVTAIAIGMRYQNIIKLLENEKKKEKKKARMAVGKV